MCKYIKDIKKGLENDKLKSNSSRVQHKQQTFSMFVANITILVYTNKNFCPLELSFTYDTSSIVLPLL